MRCAALAVLVACSAAPATQVRSAEAPPAGHALGMNDVSILLPLPGDVGVPVLAALAGDEALVERRWLDALVPARGDIARFDLCDRLVIGRCPAGAAGRLRLVLQPLYARAGATFAHDVALHAFYPIPAAEMTAVVDELRRLSGIQHAPPGAPLAVSPAAAAGDAGYLRGLRALVLRYARATELVRLTVIGQVADSAAFAWIFRGVDRRSDALVPMVIPGIAGAQQTVQLAGGDTVYRADQIADLPAGFTLATNGPRFAAATSAQRGAALAALVELQNPALHDTVDTQCVGCHLATYLTSALLSWTDADGLKTLATLPADAAGVSLGGIVQRGDGTLVIASFGFGTHGGMVAVTAGTASALAGLDPSRRRVGLARAEGAIYSGYFVGGRGKPAVGGVATVTIAGSAATETEIASGFHKVVGLVATPAAVFVSDQTDRAIYKIELPGYAVSRLASVPAVDLLAMLPGGDLLTGGGPTISRITQAGRVTTLAGGFEQVRGLAYDEAGEQLFVIDHSVTVGLPDKLRVVRLRGP